MGGYEPADERLSMGVKGLDEMLDGGVWRGTTTLLAGPSGAGKTTIGLQFALEGARVGEPERHLGTAPALIFTNPAHPCRPQADVCIWHNYSMPGHARDGSSQMSSRH